MCIPPTALAAAFGLHDNFSLGCSCQWLCLSFRHGPGWTRLEQVDEAIGDQTSGARWTRCWSWVVAALAGPDLDQVD